ncbi:alpha-lytic protease prodomain-containing protein [Actinotalea ferrariae]|uniref:S1 family peptidase n=1 Tax=Actinotalea ferrariae TaxID=1386098 RepID=UPI001C8B164C|nr:S1 family peptidase [Actinotalea ferrariae]MBX9245347.1 alpha-lytic protease prodomain-containing protein [Actinotalea ferrariae]
MRTTSVARGLAAATASATLLAGAFATQAAAAPPDDAAGAAPAVEKLAPGLLRAMERDLGLDAQEARQRLAFQDDAADTGTALEQELGSDFAGSWVAEDQDVLYVAITDAADAAAVQAEGATAVTVDHTLAELDGWATTLDTALVGQGDVVGWHVDVTTNDVVVNVAPGAEQAAADVVAAAGVPADAVTFVETAEAPRTYVDVIGGNAYSIGSSRCSIGFSVAGGFVTAGHCGRTGATTSGPSGTFAGSSFPGNDYAFVRVAAGNTPIGAVNNYSGGRVAVAGSTAAPVGSSVCRSGSTTGWHCGTIQALNASVSYSQGTVSGLIRTNVCAEPGDSGGSLLAGNQAQGVTSGGSGNCRTGGTTYFQPVNEILGAYGLTLVTSDGGGGNPPPPPAGCTGYARTYTGSLTSGAQAVQPNGSYLTVSRSGQHRACVAGPSGSDFDLYLQKWNGRAWSTVAQGTSPGANETITYSGTSGYYRYVVLAYSGSGAYTLGGTTP